MPVVPSTAYSQAEDALNSRALADERFVPARSSRTRC